MRIRVMSSDCDLPIAKEEMCHERGGGKRSLHGERRNLVGSLAKFTQLETGEIDSIPTDIDKILGQLHGPI